MVAVFMVVVVLLVHGIESTVVILDAIRRLLAWLF